MAKFRYTAKDMEGTLHKGTLEASNEGALRQQLRGQELFLIKAKEQAERKKYGKLKAKQLASFCRELSTLIASGVTLAKALSIISEQEGIDSKEREVYRAVLADVRKGILLSEAMEATESFPELLIGMLKSGEGNGNLDEVADRLAIQYDKENTLNQQVRSAMTYPMILLVLCIAIVILIVTFILPQFQILFDQLESLPLVTKILIAISDFLVQQWYVAILAVACIYALVRVIVGIGSVRLTIDHCKVKLPVFGNLFKTVYTARFARTLSSLYSSGMPLATATSVAAKTVGNRYIEGQFENVLIQVRSGVPLSKALKEVDGFLKKLSSTILIGEESGCLDVMLDSIAESLEEEAEQATKRMVTLLEPILIVFMALVVGFILIAVMLPIYESYSAIESM